MVDINLLDKTLNFIKREGLYGLIEEETPEFTAEENEYLHQAAKRLEKDGYIYSEYKDQYMISFDGLLALDETFWFLYKDKPYKRRRFQRRAERAWLALKIFCAVLNALAIIALGILSLFKN